MDSQPLRRMLCDIAHQLKRNKALTSQEGWLIAAVDGHEFFAGRRGGGPWRLNLAPRGVAISFLESGSPTTRPGHKTVKPTLLKPSIRFGRSEFAKLRNCLDTANNS